MYIWLIIGFFVLWSGFGAADNVSASGAPGRAAALLPPVSTLLSNAGSEQAVDIVLVGDKYSRADNTQGGALEADARRFMEVFFNEPPFDSHRGFFNVHLVRSISPDEGPSLFDVRYGTAGLRRLMRVRRQAVLQEYASRAPDCDIIFVLVKSGRYGGGGGEAITKAALYPGRPEGPGGPMVAAPVYAAGHPRAVRIAMHELGHGFAGLADEYADQAVLNVYIRSLPEIQSREGAVLYVQAQAAQYPNVDIVSNRHTVKWRKFFESAPGSVGIYEGGLFLDRGVYRSAQSCIMRSVTAQFCPVCRMELVRNIYKRSGRNFDEAAYHRGLSGD